MRSQLPTGISVKKSALNKAVLWTSSDEEVATVDGTGLRIWKQMVALRRLNIITNRRTQ